MGILYFPRNDLYLDDGTEIPGTEKLVDVDQTLTTKQQVDDNIILVPQPSASLDDPLIWTSTRKIITLIWPMWYTCIVAVLAAVPAISYPEMQKDSGISLSELTSGTGYLFLFFGLGCLFWQPIALNFGRRPVYTYTLLIGGVACPIWLNYITKTGEYYANRIICGFLLSSVESLGEVVVGDLYFTHQRGFGINLYLLALLSGTFLGPLVGGFVVGSLGWKWLNNLLAIFCGVGAILTYIFMEETMFYRPVKCENISEVNGVEETGRSSSKEKNYANSQTNLSNEHSLVPRRKRYLEKYPILYHRSAEQPNIFFKSIIRPLQIFIKFIPVTWAGMIVASALAWWSVAGATIARILGGPPYYFSSYGLGLVYLAPFIAAVFSAYIGSISDRFCIWMARRNNGVLESEFRLYVGLFCPLFLTPVGMWMYGVGAARHSSWVVVVIGYALSTVGTCLGQSLPYAYVMDSYPRIGGDSMVTVILIRNIVGGFAFNYAIIPWLAHDGTQNTFIILGILSLVSWLSVIPLIIFGKRFRRRGAKLYREFT